MSWRKYRSTPITFSAWKLEFSEFSVNTRGPSRLERYFSCIQEIWALSHYTGTGFIHRCKDAFENDASLIHPTEVTRWDCEDDDGVFVRDDAVETVCGCPTSSSTAPEPTPAPLARAWATLSPTPAPLTPTLPPSTPTPEPVAPVSPSSCGATESFRITSAGLREVEGCFQATDASFSNEGGTLEIWSVSGTTDLDQISVFGFADDGTGDVVSQTPSQFATLRPFRRPRRAPRVLCIRRERMWFYSPFVVLAF